MKMKDLYKMNSATGTTRKAAFLAACLFLCCAMTAMAQNIYYVKPLNEASKGNGSSWQDATTLYEALRQAEAGDEIRLMGYEKVDSREKVYVVPSEEGFAVRQGVKIYGGFSGTPGTETTETPDNRARRGDRFEFHYISVVVADRDKDDKYFPAGPSLIFPTGDPDDLRADNAPHVFTLATDGTEATMIDGLTIAAAHNTDANRYGPGGAVTISGNGTYHIRHCFFLYNYAPTGGAIYVHDGAGSDASTIESCYLMNNAAGTRSSQQNDGGGIYLAGRGMVVNTVVANNENGGILMSPKARVVQSTVTRNTAAAVELELTAPAGGSIQVYNTVIWGNSALYETEANKPGMSHCAYPEADKGAADGNIYAGAKNFDLDDYPPLFDNPAPKMGFNQDFNWLAEPYPSRNYSIRDGSVLIDQGDATANLPEAARALVAQDVAGTARPLGRTNDIGAYEHRSVEAGHIRYVKAGATGDGTSWTHAMGDLQQAIDELAALGGQGEVWVAAGTYRPTRQLVTGDPATIFFRMRDGISVYGGFPANHADDFTRADLTQGAMPWIYEGGETILEGAGYDGNCTWTGNYWSPTSESYHVVWFAPMDGEADFGERTVLSGVTIRGGYALGTSGTDGLGGGVYMQGEQAVLLNCVVKENRARNHGGGVYLDEGGRMEGCLLFNNSAMDGDGGAVYADTRGEVLRCMLANNSAHNGGGIYMECPENGDPDLLTLSTSVVSNNHSIENAAVYCHRGGSVVQSTIVNNYTPRATDAAMPDASKTGGLYLNGYGLVVNSVLWNNHNGTSGYTPFFAFNPTTERVRFYNTAVSGYNSAVWYNTLQQDILRLSDDNNTTGDGTDGLIAPGFSTGGAFTDADALQDLTGVQSGWTAIDYYWQPERGSNLRAMGLPVLSLPDDIRLTPEVDLAGVPLHDKPALGAHRIDAVELQCETNGNALRLYVNVDCQDPTHDGLRWNTAYRSLNEAIAYMASLTDERIAEIAGQNNNISNLEIYVLEHEAIYPRYAFVSDDPKSATIEVPAMASGRPLLVKGGFPASNAEGGTAADADPLNHRSVIDGNPDGRNPNEGLYHCITVRQGANVTFEGFHIINGNAAGEAVRLQGGGLFIDGTATVTLRDCILENLSADRGAALYGEQATVTMENCVVNNNTNATESAAVVIAGSLTLRHVTFAQNFGGTYSLYGDGTPTAENCFAAGNTSDNSTVNGQALPENFVSATNFQNPTNQRGATLGFDTYRGGYSSFRPLTSSTDAADALINQGTAGTTLDHDIMGNARDLGGTPDLGAYEADLPEAGTVLYVRASDGNDNNDGTSWGTAFQTVAHALEVAERTTPAAERPQIWVAAGEYTHTPGNDEINSQRYAYKMVEGANLYGGFPSAGAPGFDDRNPNEYKTILQPQENPTEFPEKENLDKRYTWLHGPASVGRVVVQPYNFTVETVWDGVTIRYGFLNTMCRYSIIGDLTNLDPAVIGLAGGGGVYLMGYGVLENCHIVDNRVMGFMNFIDGYTSGGGHVAGGGIYCKGGSIRNCQILRNAVWNFDPDIDRTGTYGGIYINGQIQAAFAYGGGLYILNEKAANGHPLYEASIFNTIIANNECRALTTNPNGAAVFHTVAIGGGACQFGGNFYNNTIVNNFALTEPCGAANITCGGMFVYNDAEIYNCIIYNNTEERGRNIGIAAPQYANAQVISFTSGHGGDENTGNDPQNGFYQMEPDNVKIHYSNVGYTDNRNQAQPSVMLTSNGDGTYRDETTGKDHNIYADPLFTNADGGNYRLESGSLSINSATEDIPGVNIPNYDAEYTARIKDCGIDMGAFESTNDGNIRYTETTATENGTTVTTATFYVTQDGRGTMRGDSLDQAACAQKLQAILDAAGEYVAGGTNRRAIVKVAGYAQAGDGATGFVYHPNADDLSDPNDPQSYTYTVPYGVTLMGGYIDNSGTVDSWDETKNADCRDILNYPTVLSPVVTLTDEQTVNGYHAVTFGTKPDSCNNTVATTTVIDGVTLSGGQATTANKDNDKGGGAVVPAWGHVRNCIVSGNTATYGGGLYLLAGATVSGTLVKDNTADYGGGIYAANKGGDTAPSTTAGTYIISSTLAANTSDDTGGGIYLEDGAAVSLNSVIWGNEAPADKDISGVTGQTYEDTYIGDVLLGTTVTTVPTAVYPFNSCFIQQAELPSTFEQNRSMTGELTDYFASTNYQLRAFSPLIKSGIPTGYHDNLVTAKDIAEADINRLERAQTDMERLERAQTDMERLDVGAFAFEGGVLPTTPYFTRLFVSPSGRDSRIDEENINIEDYLGRSFYTPFSHLDEALEYIRRVREYGKAQGQPFEILLAEGTYKPTYKRANAPADVTVDQRQNSFNIPAGVSLYGGFIGNELYSSDEITGIPGLDDITFTPDGNINAILAAREFSDLNTNGILEPWELGRQSILSGDINVSGTEGKAYHVVYSSDESHASGGVTLDGLTIMDGMTLNRTNTTDDAEDGNEVGRGGGIYSSGVDYTLNRCRLLQNRAVIGNALYARSARVRIFGSMLAGNSTVDNPQTSGSQGYLGGGAALVYGGEGLSAFNTLWANNSTTGDGGAVAVFDANDTQTPVLLVNNAIVRNESEEYAVAAQNGTIVNTVAWGNAYNGANTVSFRKGPTVSHSATEDGYWVDGQAPSDENHNITIDTSNGSVTGPRFAAPSATAGAAGFSSASQWSPAAVSILTDVGDGMVDKDWRTGSETAIAPPATPEDLRTYYDNATDAYKSRLWDTYGQNDPLRYAYMEKAQPDVTAPFYLRYSGPKDEEGQYMDRIIDIGLYEYQYNLSFDKMDTIYVATTDAGDADGSSWANATSDLRGAIVGLANSTGDEDATTLTPYNAVLIRQGTYSTPPGFTSSTGSNGRSAFKAVMHGAIPLDGTQSYAETLSIRGSYNEQGVQDFSQPTVIEPFPGTEDETQTLLDINALAREVYVEGILFHNTNPAVGSNCVAISTLEDKGDKGYVTLKDVQVRASQTGVVVNKGSAGRQMLVNVLFADNAGTGLQVDENNTTTTVINGTFAQNATDFTGSPTVQNSVAWKNTKNQHLSTLTDNETNHNVAFAPETDNDDIVNGPNFVNPTADDVLSRDYHIRPGIALLDQGDDEPYETFMKDYRYPGFKTSGETDEQFAAAKAAETDLGGTARFVDGSIDVGAYEYAAPMRQIIYVDDRLTTAGDGSSWENALTDLQDAVNLAGIYANTRPDEYGYVFAQSTVGQDGRVASLNVQLGGTKVYGGMHTERYNDGKTEATDIVAGLLTRRRGMMESQGDHSQVTQLVIKPAQGEGRNTATSVVDGFQVTGGATVGQGGMLSTSIVEDHGGTYAVTMKDDGILYNSFVDGAAGTTGTIVNVTATGTINAGTNENNRPSTTAPNRYIQSQTDAAWNYQLNEESADIDHSGNADIKTYIELAGHNRDLAGNTRVMNGTPDNGCFETWSVPATATDATAATIWNTEDHSTGPYDAHVALGKHYPVAGSVVYVNEGSGLAMNHTTTADTPFRPGYLLLKEGASLYGNGRDVSLPYVATERTLSQGWNLCAVPYALTRDGINRVDTDGGSLSLDVLAVADSTETYDGAARAASLFAFHETNSAFWNPATSFAACQGFALKAAEAAGTYRFTAGAENATTPVYSETADETEKTVALTQYDENTVNADGTPKFTFKENMGWNLFGLPYLVSDYDLTAKLTGTTTPAMDLPHILYTLQDGQYFTVQSWDGITTRPDGTTDGTLSFGKGVFTQTAVIGDDESLGFRRPSAPGETTDGNGVNLQQYRLGLWGETGADGFVFSPTNEETDGDFTLGADGLKMMAPRADAPQLYAVNRTGTRFSLMNAVDAAGSVQVGIRAVAGDYTMGLGETADIETATEVWLTDHKTGAKVDLRRTDYRFTLTEAADDAARFTLSFSSIADDTAGTLNVYVRRRILYVEGLREGDTVTLYDPSGTRVHAERTTGGSFRHALKPGIYLVHVSGQKSARKVFVQ